MQKELSITIKCDGKTVTAEILEPESGDFVAVEEPYTPDERNSDWRERVSNEIYSWIELGWRIKNGLRPVRISHKNEECKKRFRF